ncbi:MAG: hypothetical protein GX494_08685 [Clostridiaceae bacterium]|mgnify:CR=1 FL=1|nr:hypothetical protein [Clostridiaceae bacterium]
MRNAREIVIFIFIFLTVLLMAGCLKETDTIAANVPATDTVPADTAKLDSVSTDVIIRENETITSLSPDGKYRAEAYGTVTTITAGGFYPYEGIRIYDIERNEVLWEMEPGGYTVSFIWSPDGKCVGIYYTGRIWGESIVVDIEKKQQISLPKLEEIASFYGEDVKPQEDRPDPYFEISGWENSETAVVDFRWTKANGDEFSGRYLYNVKTKEIVR